MSPLLWFLLLACLLSILALASPLRSIWSRMLIGPFLSVVYLLDFAGQIRFVVPGFFVVGSLWLITFRRRERFTLDQFKYAIGPIASAILLVCFVAFRPSLLEYPVDHINYWQRLIHASSTGSPDVLTCGLGGLTVYDATCTLWLLSLIHISEPTRPY